MFDGMGNVNHESLEIIAQNIAEMGEKRNLKGWTVKLPEQVIKEIEHLYEASGLRFKNEFVEHLINEHKVNLVKEGKAPEGILHPEIMKRMSGDVYELAKLTQMINEIFVQQLEKFSVEQYEIDRLNKKIDVLTKQKEELEQKVEELNVTNQTGHSVLSDYLHQITNQHMGHRLFWGTSGTGKSYAAKLEIKKAIEMKKQAIVIDFTGEYKHLVEKMGGKHIEISSSSGMTINPFEISIRSKPYEVNLLTEKILNVYSLIELMVHRSMNSNERKVLLNALEDTYRNYGITREDWNKLDQEKLKIPTLTDLDKALRKYEHGIAISDELDPYINGFLNIFNGQQTFFIDNDTPLIVFDIQKIERELTEVVAFAVLQLVDDLLKKGSEKQRFVVIDELWILTNNRQSLDYLTKMLKYVPPHKHEILGTTQQARDFLFNAEEAVKAFQTKVYFKQHPNDVKAVAESVQTNTLSIDVLKVLGKGEALVSIGNDIQYFMKFPRDDDADTDPLAMYRNMY